MAVAAAVGAALSPGTISGEASRMLVTFLGLLSASVLPTISLLVNSMTGGSRSVQALNRLQEELQAAMDALFLLFGSVAVVVVALIALAIEPPTFLASIPYLTTQVLPRGGQMTVIAVAALILLRAGQIPAILRRSLAVRHEIAVSEAKRQVAERAPDSDATRAAFPTHPDFGKAVKLDDLPGREPH